jgi:hypothetical protein
VLSFAAPSHQPAAELLGAERIECRDIRAVIAPCGIGRITVEIMLAAPALRALAANALQVAHDLRLVRVKAIRIKSIRSDSRRKKLGGFRPLAGERPQFSNRDADIACDVRHFFRANLAELIRCDAPTDPFVVPVRDEAQGASILM